MAISWNGVLPDGWQNPIFDLDAQQGAGVGIEGGFPKLLGIHFAKTFVALGALELFYLELIGRLRTKSCSRANILWNT